MDRINELIAACRLMEKDHRPEGFPPILMRDVTLLCNVIEQMYPVLDRLQDRLEAGARIEFQNSKWHLFDSDGEQVCYGDSIREMLVNLIMVDC